MRQYWLIPLWLLYFLFPYDVVPDFLPAMGRLDDILLLVYLYWSHMRKAGKPSEEEAGKAGGWTGPGAGGYTHRSQSSGRYDNGKDPYGILGVAPSASPKEILQAYRHQASLYHPDKVAHLGPELQALAREKFLEIQWAYEQIIPDRKKA